MQVLDMLSKNTVITCKNKDITHKNQCTWDITDLLPKRLYVPINASFVKQQAMALLLMFTFQSYLFIDNDYIFFNFLLR